MTHKERAARREVAILMIRQGYTIDDVAQKTGLSAAYIYGFAKAKKPKKTKNVYNILAELLNTNDTQSVIAARFNVSQQRVHEVLQKAKDAGIKFQSR